MKEPKLSYYQYRSKLNYQVFLRFDDAGLEAALAETLEVLGFDLLSEETFKKLNFKRYKTKILKISKASFNVSRQISQVSHLNDKFGFESLNQMGNYNIYRFRDVGMMIYSEMNPMWELGLKTTHNKEAIRCVLTRFLSFAFTATQTEVVGLWGVPVEQGVVVMSPKKSNFESVFVDVAKNQILCYGEVKTIESEVEILRLDETFSDSMRVMSREELLSFLSVSTCHLSFSELDINVREVIFKICHLSKGFIYPEENFKPRLTHSDGHKEAA